MSALLLGILASIATEIVTKINKELGNSVLKGDGAFLLAAFIAVVFAIGQYFWGASESFQMLATHVATIFASSTAFFLVVVQTLGLDVKS